MKRKSLKELERILKDKYDRLNHDISIYKNNDNPQIKEKYVKISAECELIEDIIHYINTGETHLLK